MQKILIPLFSLLVSFPMSSLAIANDADTLGIIAHNSEPAETEVIVDQLKLMRGEIENLQHEVSQLKEQMGKLSNDTNLRLKDINKSPSKNDSINTEQEIKFEQSKDDADELYQKSYGLLKEKKYGLAAKQFNLFLKQHPNHQHAASAHYWIAEIKMMDKQYDQAAVEYMRGYKINPKGNRAQDNLLKLAGALGKINKRREACLALSKLKKEFPELSENIKKGLDEQLKTLSCE
jgi:tol-pal system protein YbgF